MKTMLRTLLILQALKAATATNHCEIELGPGEHSILAPGLTEVVQGVQNLPCILVEDFIEFEGGHDTIVWKCETYGVDSCIAGSNHTNAEVTIQGMDHVLAKGQNIESGKTTVLAEGAALADFTLTITGSNTLTFGEITSDAASRRRLSAATGSIDLLVVRVSATDKSMTKSAAELSGDVFGTAGSNDVYNFKSQVEECSNNALTVNPAVGSGTGCVNDPGQFDIHGDGSDLRDCDYFTNWYMYTPGDMCVHKGTAPKVGDATQSANTRCCACGGGDAVNYDNNVVDGVMDLQLPLSMASSTSQFQTAAIEALEDLFYVDRLTDKFDNVMLCFPYGTNNGGSTGWVAYAGLGGYYSVYNGDDWCANEITQVHEIGHNWGLHHSSEGGSEYGDTSAAMGSTIGAPDDAVYGNRMCFNGAHSWQLGWYTAYNHEIDPLTSSYCGTLVGVDRVPNLLSGEKLVLKLDDSAADEHHYVMYNHAVGMNAGTTEYANKVLVTKKVDGMNRSYLVGILGQGDSATFSNWNGSGQSVTVTVTSLTTDASTGNAEVQVTSTNTGPAECAETPTLPTSSPSSAPSNAVTLLDFNGEGCFDYDPADTTWRSIATLDDYTATDKNLDFDFTFAGQTFDKVNINSNGHVFFGPGRGNRYYTNGDFINENDFVIAPFWADVNTQIHGYIRYKRVAGNKFVVLWEEVAEFGGNSESTNTFQVVLSSDASGDPQICVCYDQMDWAGTGATGVSAGPESGFLFAKFSGSGYAWNGIGSSGNGLGHLNGHSYCFDSDINSPLDIISTNDDIITIPPVETPTSGPTAGPTYGATTSPSSVPSVPPTSGPTAGPTYGATTSPSSVPSLLAVPPTSGPTAGPTYGATTSPSSVPSLLAVPPTSGPTAGPTYGATTSPSSVPSLLAVPPTSGPTAGPTYGATTSPTSVPSLLAVPPTSGPTAGPTYGATTSPTSVPSAAPAPVKVHLSLEGIDNCDATCQAFVVHVLTNFFMTLLYLLGYTNIVVDVVITSVTTSPNRRLTEGGSGVEIDYELKVLGAGALGVDANNVADHMFDNSADESRFVADLQAESPSTFESLSGITSETVNEEAPPPQPLRQPEVTGDPHFKTWKDEHFEFHGQCDLVMISDKDFANGLGIDIHIRTKLVRYWSYIQKAVIRIGNDILEVEGQPDFSASYWINYEHMGELEDLGGFPVTLNENTDRYTIDLSSMYPGEKIQLRLFKEFVGVKVYGATAASFGGSVGVIGDFATGNTYARDGHTVLDDFTELGIEWQVLPSDGHLFLEQAPPQFPETCILPEDPQGNRRRRLDESTVTEEEAEAACAGLEDEFSRKGCVYDILATQDLDMVGAY